MAGLLIAGAVAAQPKVSAFVDKLKARRQESKQRRRDAIDDEVAATGSSSSSSSSSRSQSLALSSADVVHVLALFLAARRLRDEAKQRVAAAAPPTQQLPHLGRLESGASIGTSLTAVEESRPPEYPPPAQDDEEEDAPDLPPAYSAHTSLTELNDVGLLWSAMIAQSMARLEAYCLDALPHPASSSSSSQQQSLPADAIVPPPDVGLAWAALAAGQSPRDGSPLCKLQSTRLPLQRLAQSSHDEKASARWLEATKLPYRLGGSSSDVLSRGLRVHCPSRSCSFSALVPFAAPRTSLDAPGSSSRRGLVQRNWRRRCQDCDQSVSLDTLVGRRLVEDIQAWCEANGGYVATHFAGLLPADEDADANDATSADIMASQLLTPLFRPALSSERQRRNEALLAGGTLGSERPGTSNSLGSAMRAAASMTFATTPHALGESLGWSFDAIRTWLRDHTLLVNPMPVLAGSKEAGMPNEYAFPDRMGGGFSAGGLNFTAENPYEEDSAKPAAVQAREKRERLVGYVERLVGPYQLLREEGQPSAEGTLRDADHEGAEAWTDVIMGVRRPFKRLLTMGKEVESWSQGRGGRSDDFPRAAVATYEKTLVKLRGSRPRGRQPPFKREASTVEEIERQLTSPETASIEVRCAHLAHELAASKDSYATDMLKHLGRVPPRSVLR